MRADNKVLIVTHDVGSPVIWIIAFSPSNTTLGTTTNIETILMGTTPEDPIRAGEHTPLSGLCSRLSKTSQYIFV